MDAKQLDRTAATMLENYYQNDMRLFFHYLSKDTVWIGPRQGQLILGRDRMVQTWTRERHNLRFKMSEPEFITQKTARDIYSQVAFFKVSTVYPDGSIYVHDQRILFIWKKKQIDGHPAYRIVMTFISNAAKNNDEDTIYAVHDDGSANDAIYLFTPEETKLTAVIRTGRSESTRVRLSSILYVESADKGNHTVFVTKEGRIHCLDPIGKVAKQTEGSLLRCHSSYIINPSYVTSIQRFQLTMDDGKVIPIPEKKYTAFRNRLEEWRRNVEERATLLVQKDGIGDMPGWIDSDTPMSAH